MREDGLAPGPVGRSLLGLAIGDCLGAGVEGWSADAIRDAHQASGGRVHQFAYEPMVWTDDTQQALTLVEATRRLGYPDPRWVAERWVAMDDRRLHRGTGRGFRGSVAEFRSGGDTTNSGRTDRAGNGAAMRIAPTAVALRRLPDEEFVAKLVDVSLITHRELRALAGMLAVAFAARALAEQAYPPDAESAKALLGQLVPWLRSQESTLMRHASVVWSDSSSHEISSALDGVLARWDSGWGSMTEWIEDFASERRHQRTRLAEGFVTASVVTGVSWSLMSDLTLPETLVEAVGFGDDTDTVAAMVGGIAGPGTPLRSMPADWLTFAGNEELIAWGSSLDKDEPLKSLPDVIDLETRLTGIVRG